MMAFLNVPDRFKTTPSALIYLNLPLTTWRSSPELNFQGFWTSSIFSSTTCSFHFWRAWVDFLQHIFLIWSPCWTSWYLMNRYGTCGLGLWFYPKVTPEIILLRKWVFTSVSMYLLTCVRSSLPYGMKFAHEIRFHEILVVEIITMKLLVYTSALAFASDVAGLSIPISQLLLAPGWSSSSLPWCYLAWPCSI